MIKLEQLLYETLPSEFIDNTPLGYVDNTERTLIKLHSFIIENFIFLKIQPVLIRLVNRPLLTTNTDNLYVQGETLYVDIKETKYNTCNSNPNFYLPEFNTSQIGLEDIDVNRVRSITLNNFTWYRI